VFRRVVALRISEASLRAIAAESSLPDFARTSSRSIPGCDAGAGSTDMRIAAIAMLSAAMTVAAVAGEQPVRLKQAAGLDKVEANCAACHSLDYVQMNSPFLDAAGWKAEVAKMINAYGAPIGSDDARIIADYLQANYGK
jgi:sulfite dehydrogenase (cytochrome) subunit B